MCEKCEETSFAGWWDCLVAGTLIKISVFVPVPAASAALSQTVHKPVMTITCSPAWHWLTLSLYGAMLSFQLYRQQHKQRCKTSNNVSQHNNISQLRGGCTTPKKWTKTLSKNRFFSIFNSDNIKLQQFLEGALTPGVRWCIKAKLQSKCLPWTNPERVWVTVQNKTPTEPQHSAWGVRVVLLHQ